ncbi:MAG: hypothetical protein M1814_000191 [Vezdaea aestivalis]|nr:MAG: hypothetical protein M1814_000191 [Vezdaea aestivalis]
MWCLPGSIGMYALALGVSHVGDTLPSPVYALLSGLNAATVGIIALAAVHLASKAITDKLTRLLVLVGAIAGMLYTALWYFPVLMAGAGLSTIIWDMRYLHNCWEFLVNICKRRKCVDPEAYIETASTCAPETESLELSATQSTMASTKAHCAIGSQKDLPPIPSARIELLSWRRGLMISMAFLFSSILIIILRSALKHPQKPLSLFANFYLAGTIIFGGGPVVIPLLREYIVAPGWVSPRNFLMGLAIIQAFPGPNFNFGVYLGALAAKDMNIPSFAGALIGFVGMFAPGMWLAVGSMGVWGRLRDNKYLKSLLRGINAAAIGLIYTAVFRLWKVGLLNENNQRGTSLGSDPWWVAISAAAFVGGQWFRLEAPYAIMLGGVLGLLWYAVVKT